MGLRLLMPGPAVGSVHASDFSMHLGGPRPELPADKPVWLDALEESLLLAISLFALITWVVLVALMNR
jgi:hypothetical protein